MVEQEQSIVEPQSNILDVSKEAEELESTTRETEIDVNVDEVAIDETQMHHHELVDHTETLNESIDNTDIPDSSNVDANELADSEVDQSLLHTLDQQQEILQEETLTAHNHLETLEPLYEEKSGIFVFHYAPDNLPGLAAWKLVR